MVVYMGSIQLVSLDSKWYIKETNECHLTLFVMIMEMELELERLKSVSDRNGYV